MRQTNPSMERSLSSLRCRKDREKFPHISLAASQRSVTAHQRSVIVGLGRSAHLSRGPGLSGCAFSRSFSEPEAEGDWPFRAFSPS